MSNKRHFFSGSLFLAYGVMFCLTWLCIGPLLAADPSAPPAPSTTTAPSKPGSLTATDSGGRPDKRTITVISPGAFKAVVSQASGGGITGMYDLANDPEARSNLAWPDRGLFEIGWHGA